MATTVRKIDVPVGVTASTDMLRCDHQDVNVLPLFSTVTVVIDRGDRPDKIVRGEYQGIELRTTGEFFIAVQEPARESGIGMPLLYMIPTALIKKARVSS